MLFSKYRLLYEKGWIKGAIKTARGFHQKEIKYPLHFNLSKSQERELDIWINRQGYLIRFYDDIKLITWHHLMPTDERQLGNSFEKKLLDFYKEVG